MFKVRNRRPPYKVSLIKFHRPDCIGLREHGQRFTQTSRQPLLRPSREIQPQTTIALPDAFRILRMAHPAGAADNTSKSPAANVSRPPPSARQSLAYPVTPGLCGDDNRSPVRAEEIVNVGYFSEVWPRNGRSQQTLCIWLDTHVSHLTRKATLPAEIGLIFSLISEILDGSR